MQDDFRPPDHYSPLGKFAYRATGTIALFISLSAFAYFVLPLVAEYVSQPFSQWAGSFFD